MQLFQPVEPILTALPATPVDGQIINFLADATNGIVWRLRHRAAGTAGKQWEFIGGSALRAFSTTQPTSTSSTDVVWPSSPSVTIPLAGDYDLTWGHSGYCSGHTTYEAMARTSLWFAGVNQGLYAMVPSSPGMVTDGADLKQAINRWVGTIAAGVILTLGISLQRPGGAMGTAQFLSGLILATPVRVG